MDSMETVFQATEYQIKYRNTTIADEFLLKQIEKLYLESLSNLSDPDLKEFDQLISLLELLRRNLQYK